MRAGTMTAAATYPTSAAEPPIARTANGIATSATAVSGHRDGIAGQQQPEVAVAQRPRPHFHVTLPYLGNGGRGPPSLTAWPPHREQPQAVTRGWAEAGARQRRAGCRAVAGWCRSDFHGAACYASLKQSFQ